MTKQIVCAVCEGRGFVSWANNTEDTCSTGSKTCPHCNGTGVLEVPMTNADRIRAMSDEELAMFLRWDICTKIRGDNRMCNGWCDERVAEWLKQPYKEEA